MNNLKVIAVGDICLGDKAIMGMGVMSTARWLTADYFFKKTGGFLKSGDITFGNLEGLITQAVSEKNAKSLTFSASPEFANAIAAAGFNVLNVANNHTLEHGPDIFQETVHHLKSAGIKVCGLRSEAAEYWSEPVILNKKGIKVGIIGYNWVGVDKFACADRFIAQVHDSIVNYTWGRTPEADLKYRRDTSDRNQHVIKDIKRLRQHVDFLILSAHWGFEFVHVPPYGAMVEAQTFIDAGVDLIVGHHPHVIQGMSQNQGKHVFYSLGNFIFDMRQRRTRLSTILEYTWGPKDPAVYQFIPVIINNTFQPEVADGKHKRRISAILNDSTAKIKQAFKTEALLDDDTVYREYEHQYRIGKLFQVIDHFSAIPKNPKVLRLIINKAMGAIKLLTNRIQGKKVRW